MWDSASIIASSLAGVLVGILTGITPGLHVNLVATVTLSLSVLLPFSPAHFAYFILSMAITHTFLDAIPSVFLGVPNPDNPGAVLPCHKLVLEGFGCEAVKLQTLGAFCCAVLGILLLPVFVLLFPLVYAWVRPVLAFVLLAILCFLILREEGSKKIFALIVVLLSALLGLLTFATLHREPLLPLLSGLFGVGSMLLNMNSAFPVQRETDQTRLSAFEVFIITVGGTLAGSVIALLPGLGPAQAGILASFLFPTKPLSFLAMSGGINTANFVVSLATMESMHKARNGALEVVLGFAPVDMHLLWRFAAVTLFVVGIATIATLRLAPFCAALLSRVSLQLVSLLVLGFIVFLVLFLSGMTGLLVLITGACIGILAQVTEVNRSHCMACILVPVILYFL